MGHQVNGTIQIKDPAKYNELVNVFWQAKNKCCPSPDGSELEFSCDSDDEQRLLDKVARINTPPNAPAPMTDDKDKDLSSNSLA